MKPHVYKYLDSDKQTVYFRGYVKKYDLNTVENITCSEVRTNKVDALNDAKKLIKKLRGV